uniref:Uncharacterized protein n=1 Tax=Anguilla anguilla TaxID=7936 RepID=A0A0E9SFR4_ANGAN
MRWLQVGGLTTTSEHTCEVASCDWSISLACLRSSGTPSRQRY